MPHYFDKIRNRLHIKTYTINIRSPDKRVTKEVEGTYDSKIKHIHPNKILTECTITVYCHPSTAARELLDHIKPIVHKN